MSLRLRIVLAVVVVLLTGAVAGVAAAGWRAQKTLQEELVAALAGARQTTVGALQDFPASERRAHDLRRLIAAFDGDRHVEALLRDTRGAIVFHSTPRAARAAPRWFAAVFGDKIGDVVLPIPLHGYGVVELKPVFANDIGAIWGEFIGLAVALAASMLAGSAFVWLTVGPALRPLSDFNAAFLRIGSGDYQVRVAAHGPLELVRLGRAVNQMTERLESMQARNQALEHQLSTLQEEERADLARDLHDEIGPQLFVANFDAAIARRLIEDGAGAQALERIEAIQGAVARMQTLVREILGRLRPTPLVELGLSAAIAELVDFWRLRRPDIRFQLNLASDDQLPHGLRETLYRVVQEGLNNAVRHGRPQTVRLEISAPHEGWVTASVADDGAPSDPPGPSGFGLVGMHERVARMHGVLTITQGASGWTVSARLPARAITLADDTAT